MRSTTLCASTVPMLACTGQYHRLIVSLATGWSNPNCASRLLPDLGMLPGNTMTHLVKRPIEHLQNDLQTQNVLFICDNRQGCRHLADHLEHLGCDCWFAFSTEELQVLLSQRPFRLVLSTRPVTEHGSL